MFASHMCSASVVAGPPGDGMRSEPHAKTANLRMPQRQNWPKLTQSSWFIRQMLVEATITNLAAAAARRMGSLLCT